MKTNQLNQIITAAEGIVIKGKSQKQEKTQIAATLTTYFNENGVKMTGEQSEDFANEYLAQRQLGLK